MRVSSRGYGLIQPIRPIGAFTVPLASTTTQVSLHPYPAVNPALGPPTLPYYASTSFYCDRLDPYCLPGSVYPGLYHGLSWWQVDSSWLLRYDFITPDRLDSRHSTCFSPPCHEVPPEYPPLRWHPWPVEPPYADRVQRWWPLREWPPSGPLPVPIEQTSNRPIEIISWREAGGLLDMII